MKLFRRRTKKEKLQKEYESKLAEAYKMSSINRAKADQLTFEAEQLAKQIESEN